MGFLEVWKLYPRKVGKKYAEKAYIRVLKQGISEQAIVTSLEIMMLTEWRGRDKAYIPHLASFLNRESFEERAEALEDEREPGEHRCTVCKPPHLWLNSEITTYECACPREYEAMQEAIAAGLARRRP